MTPTNKPRFGVPLLLAGLCIPAAVVALLLGLQAVVGWLVVAFFLLLAIGVRAYPAFRGLSFTLTVFAAVSVAMFYPQHITEINGFNTSALIVPLLQIIMFGMGTALSLSDFSGV